MALLATREKGLLCRRHQILRTLGFGRKTNDGELECRCVSAVLMVSRPESRPFDI